MAGMYYYPGMKEGGTSSTSTRTSTLNLASMPKYKEPTYDYSKARYYGQEEMAPQLALARRGLQRMTSGYFDNPAEREAAIEAGLAGYGQALGSIQAGGMAAGRGRYGEELAGQRKQAISDYERAMMEWKLKQTEREQRQLGLQQPQPTQQRQLPTQYIETGYKPIRGSVFEEDRMGGGQTYWPAGSFGTPTKTAMATSRGYSGY